MASVLWSRSAWNSISSPNRRTSCPLSRSFGAEDAEILAEAAEDAGGRAPDRLDRDRRRK